MPLPPALAARLAKRGIISLPNDPEPEAGSTAEEEIIAEDYDEAYHLEGQTEFNDNKQEKFEQYLGYTGCPNKWNVYHECTKACVDKWKIQKPIDPTYDQRRLKMLAKYPLLEHWCEVLDVGIGRYYYWNTKTDLVSWLPPGHPKCQVSRSAAVLRHQMAQDRKNRIEEELADKEHENGIPEKPKTYPEDIRLKVDNFEGEGDDSDDKDRREIKRLERKRSSVRDKERSQRDKRSKRRKNSDDLDPMDPASYGDCLRGTWSSGLPQKDEAKTGVDTTATGPLFQMRPYPSPGSVLRANASANAIGPKKS